MIKQNKTKLHFILAGALMLTLAVAACNNNSEKAPENTVVTPAPPVRDSTDSMEKVPGSVAPVNDTKPNAN